MWICVCYQNRILDYKFTFLIIDTIVKCRLYNLILQIKLKICINF